MIKELITDINDTALCLHPEFFNAYDSKHESKIIKLREKETADIEESILNLISEYETSKELLADAERNLDKKETQFKIDLEKLKLELMVKEELKATPAKLRAEEELETDKEQLRIINHSILLLKSNIHSIEYQLKLKFIQLQNKE